MALIWTEAAIRSDAKRYPTRSAWQKASQSAYLRARTLKLLDTCCAHMPNVASTFTLDVAQAKALTFPTRRAWRLGCPTSYAKASTRKWLTLCPAQDGIGV